MRGCEVAKYGMSVRGRAMLTASEVRAHNSKGSSWSEGIVI